ncbi:WD40 repeat domain-containing protein [Streptacidiphilus sp. EB129]|uniref:WD40 repeat domain-containing protein n=1 Tax=Streptacidiphilus sp. EB129 TaxID=3156262 RepID=UPI0035112EEA
MVLVLQGAGVQAVLCTLTLHRVRGLRRRSAASPRFFAADPALRTDRSFDEAAAAAHGWAAGQRRFPRRAAVRWSILDAEGEALSSVEGASAGAALAVGLALLLGLSRAARRPIHKRTVISAAVDDAGLLRSVDGLNHKVPAVASSGHRLVVAAADGAVARSAAQGGRPETQTAVSVTDAVTCSVLQRGWITPVLGAAVLAAAVVAFFLLRSATANEHAQAAQQAQGLSAQSRADVGAAPDTAARLALQAEQLEPDDQGVRSALFGSAYFDPRLSAVITPPSTPHAVVYDATGTEIAVAEGTAVELYSADHRLLARTDPARGSVTTVAFTRDHRLLLGTDQGSVLLWTPGRSGTSTAQMVFTGTGRTQALAVSSSGDMIAWAVSGSGVYAAPTPEPGNGVPGSGVPGNGTPGSGRRVAAPDGRITALALPTSGRLVVGRDADSKEPSLLLYDLADTAAQPRVLLTAPALGLGSNGVTALALTDGGRRLVSGHADEALRVWDTATFTTPRTIHVSGSIYAFALSQDGQTAAVATHNFPPINAVDLQSPDTQVFTVALADGQQAGTPYESDYGALTAVLGLAPSGEEVAAGTVSGRITFWKPSLRPDPRGSLATVVADPVTPGAVLALYGNGQVSRYTPGTTGQPVAVVDIGGYGPAATLSLDPGGSLLAVGHGQGAVSVWPYPHRSVPTAVLHTGTAAAVYRLAFSPNGGELMAGDASGRTWRFDPHGGRPQPLVGDTDQAPVGALAFDPGGSTLLISHRDGYAAVVDPSTGRLLREARFTSDASTVLTEADGGYLIGFGDGHLARYDADLKLTSTLTAAHGSNVLAAAQSPDHTLLATAGADANGMITDLADGSALLSLPASESPPGPGESFIEGSFLSVAFTADGRYAVFGSVRGHLTAISVDRAGLQARLCSLMTSDQSPGATAEEAPCA